MNGFKKKQHLKLSGTKTKTSKLVSKCRFM